MALGRIYLRVFCN